MSKRGQITKKRAENEIRRLQETLGTMRAFLQERSYVSSTATDALDQVINELAGFGVAPADALVPVEERVDANTQEMILKAMESRLSQMHAKVLTIRNTGEYFKVITVDFSGNRRKYWAARPHVQGRMPTFHLGN